MHHLGKGTKILSGRVAEWFNAPPWKGGIWETVSGVQISPLPLRILKLKNNILAPQKKATVIRSLLHDKSYPVYSLSNNLLLFCTGQAQLLRVKCPSRKFPSDILKKKTSKQRVQRSIKLSFGNNLLATVLSVTNLETLWIKSPSCKCPGYFSIYAETLLLELIAFNGTRMRRCFSSSNVITIPTFLLFNSQVTYSILTIGIYRLSDFMIPNNLLFGVSIFKSHIPHLVLRGSYFFISFPYLCYVNF